MAIYALGDDEPDIAPDCVVGHHTEYAVNTYLELSRRHNFELRRIG